MCNVLITSGGTQAPIDDVRMITNASTGHLGATLAEAALDRGARVWHLRTPLALRPFHRLARFDLDHPDPTAEVARLDLLRRRWLACRDHYHPAPLATGTMPEYADTLNALLTAHHFDIIFLAMAASDYAPDPHPGKIASDDDHLVIRCHRLPKLIATVRDRAPSSYLVGFKLLANAPLADLIRQATRAGLANRADLTVANDLATVRAGQHTLHLVRPGHPPETLAPPTPIAPRLIERVWNWSQPTERY